MKQYHEEKKKNQEELLIWENKIAKYIGEIAKIEGVSERTMELVRRFDDVNKAKPNIKPITRFHNIRVLKAFLEDIKKPIEETSTDAILDFFLRGKGKYSSSTLNNFRAILSKFFRWEGKGQFPERLAGVKEYFFREDVETIPKILLDVEDIKKLVDVATNPRDKLLPVFLYESGCRIGEALNVKLKDITFDQFGSKVILEGKTGQRTVRLIDAAPALGEWINSHPGRNNDESFLFCPANEPGRSFTNINAIMQLRHLAKLAKITKRVNPHSFRHARATALTSELREYEMKAYMGWTMGSDMANVYIHKSGMDIDSRLLANRGLIDANHNGKAKEIPKIVCPACEKANTMGNRFCYSCGQGLDSESIQKYKQQQLGIAMIKFMEAAPGGEEFMRRVARENAESLRKIMHPSEASGSGSQSVR